jgi:hypothetical protein
MNAQCGAAAAGKFLFRERLRNDCGEPTFIIDEGSPPMTPLLIAMTLLGCSDAGDQCQTVRVLPTHYVSVDACNAAAEDVLTRLTEADAPVMAVHCAKLPATTLALATTR